ncbi:MAG TPA: hypothetical protein EYO75_06180 [Sulfurimonas sp.]|nr:hypothetical protein [Sulfurimonas sp.]HIM75404.1 hypothetical protein [Campylobacterales bacterium]
MILGFGVTYAVSQSANNEILNTRMEKMSKIQYIEDYFEEMKYILNSHANNSNTVQLLWDFDEALENLEELEIDRDEIKDSLMQYYKDSYLANNNYYLIGAPIQR